MSGPTRRFEVADQAWFARASGDVNPLHMDPAWAARTFPGAPVVHGVHALLWGLEQHLAGAPPSAPIAGLTVTFVKPILLGDDLEVESGADGSTMRLLVRGELVMVVRLELQAKAADAMDGATGAIRLPKDALSLPATFTRVAAAIGSPAVRGLAAISALVGMESPGLHGVLSELSVSVGGATTEALSFRVNREDAVFSRIEMAVSGLSLRGTVAAFAGRAPAPPADDDAIRALVTPGAYAGQAPLVIGATSGLGATTARLLAAGGAKPLLSYRREDDIETILSRSSSLCACGRVRFDVTAPAEGLAALSQMGWSGAQVYYFASPRIFRRRLEPYQGDDLRAFLEIYVDGFYDVVRGLMRARGRAALSVFYPSSTAIEEPAPELFEYKIAKAAGEQLCERLRQKYRALTITAVRLPRVDTRQTRTFIKVGTQTPEAVMAPIIRRVQTAGADGR